MPASGVELRSASSPASGVELRSASSPAVQVLLSRLQSGTPTVAFVTGVSGSGKTELLDSCRSLLQHAGTQVTSTPDGHSDSAVIVDDAHGRDPEVLIRIARFASSPTATVIVASEPRFHDSAVCELRRALGAAGSAFTLAPLSRSEILSRAGGSITPSVAEAIRIDSGGIRAAVNVALAAVQRATEDPTEPEKAAREAISHWQQRRLRELDTATLDVLTIAGLHPAPDPDTIGATLGIDRDSACGALDRARGSGFLSGTDTLLTSAAPVLRVVRGEHVIASVHRSLIDVLLTHGVLREDTAVTAARAGIGTPALAQMLADAAELAPAARAVTLWTAALAAGADPGSVNLPLADAAVRSGDLDTATPLVDAALLTLSSVQADGSPTARRDAVRIAASIAARRGSYSRCADLYRWLGPEQAGADASLGVLALLATGDRAGAQVFNAAAAGAPPTTENSRALLLANGLMTSLTTSRAAALSSMLRAASLARPNDRAEPDSAAALATLLALHGGDLVGARAALTRSANTSAVREKLLFAWTVMLGGDLNGAADIAKSTAASQFRDQLLTQSLSVATARRRGDAGGLVTAWKDAASIVAEMEVDLFTLLPLGELWLAAVRLGDSARLAHLIDDADRLLGELGSPAAWATSWSWYGVQAAILSDDPAALIPYARALGEAAAGGDTFAAALADAGRAWLRVMQGTPDAAEVEAAARKLEQVGLPWDAARLASEAALRVDDTQSATTLLQVARLVTGTASPTTNAAPSEQSAASPLSEREAEVARHLLLGHTYREIGAHLYISAKTVEHHVARIRRRIGAGSRSEMLSMLRAAGYGPGATE